MLERIWIKTTLFNPTLLVKYSMKFIIKGNLPNIFLNEEWQSLEHSYAHKHTH